MKFLLLLILIGCSQGTIKKPDVGGSTPVPQVKVESEPTWGTPVYTGGLFQESIELIKKWAVSPEFTTFVAKKRTKFSHTEGTVTSNLARYVVMMGSRREIPITMYWRPGSAAIGGWNPQKGKILENSTKKLSVIRRAGHLLHETSHVFGWKHEGNYPDKNDNLNSFPYAIGYDFEEFLALKTGAAIAAE